MLVSKRVEHRKRLRDSMAGEAMRGSRITNGPFGLATQEPCWIRSNQIEAARVTLIRYTKHDGKIWIKISPDKSVTAKPAEIRMSSGKGSTGHWVVAIEPGHVLFKIDGIAEADTREALRLVMRELPCKCKTASKEEANVGADGASAMIVEDGEQSENERVCRRVKSEECS